MSLFEVLEQLTIPQPPNQDGRLVVPMRSAFMTLWARKDPDVPVHAIGRVRVLDPLGEQLGAWTHEIDLHEHVRTRNRLLLYSQMFSVAGHYEWEVSYALLDEPDEWQAVASIPLQVIFEDHDVEEDEEDEG